MQAINPSVQQSLDHVISVVSIPFWDRTDFWISTGIGLFGLYFSIRAFHEAKRAKKAAVEAGRTVKIQTVAIELSEVSQKLDAIEPDISFSEARNLLAEISRKLRRVTSPFADDLLLSEAISSLRDAMDAAQVSLKAVRPASEQGESEASSSVYYGIENDFSNINNLIADLIGLLEKNTISLGEANGNPRD